MLDQIHVADSQKIADEELFVEIQLQRINRGHGVIQN